MTSVPVPAAEAASAEPSGTKIGPVSSPLSPALQSLSGWRLRAAATPTGHAINIAGFSSGPAAKAALATWPWASAVVQIVTAMGIYGRIPLTGRLGRVPCIAGLVELAVLISVPVAVHCLYALGFQTYDARVVTHSIFGCFFYGAFVFKMLILTRDDSPKWALPLAGGLVLSGLTALCG